LKKLIFERIDKVDSDFTPDHRRLTYFSIHIFSSLIAASVVSSFAKIDSVLPVASSTRFIRQIHQADSSGRFIRQIHQAALLSSFLKPPMMRPVHLYQLPKMGPPLPLASVR
jgi:hypothetical protein